MKIKKIHTVLFALAIVSLHAPAYAEIIDYKLGFNYEVLDGGLRINRDLDLQRRQTNEIIRGSDLSRRVAEFIRKTKESLFTLKKRQTDRARGVELNKITSDNTKDLIRRTKAMQRDQRRLQRDQKMAARARNRDLKQRIRDLSRR